MRTSERYCVPSSFSAFTAKSGYRQRIGLLTARLIDGCVEHYLLPDLGGSLFIGIDASIKRDCTAIVCIKYSEHNDQLVLADHKIWKPTPGQPINLDSSVEFYLRRIYGEFLGLRL